MEKMLKIIGIIILIADVIFCSIRVINHARFAAQYKKEVRWYWDLAEKASDIKTKSQYIDKFVYVLDRADLNGVNRVLFFPTPETDFTVNFIALKSLQKRLHDIQNMDENSFAYQTAMQQITEQEQGQADDMLWVFRGCWYRHYHFLY